MDIQKALEYRNSRNLFCKQLGITVTELSLGYAKTVKAGHGRGCKSHRRSPRWPVTSPWRTLPPVPPWPLTGHKAVTLNAQYSFFRSAKPGDTLTAEAREVKHGGTVCVYDIAIHESKR